MSGAESRLRATRFGTRKMPEPMMVPATMATASINRNWRGNSAGLDIIEAYRVEK